MRVLAFIGVVAIVAAIGAAAYFFDGFYNVAASVDDPAIVNWALVHVRERSIERRAKDSPPLKLDDPATIRDGAKAFAASGCAHCHGAPGVTWSKFSEGLNPGPPDLKDAAGDPPAALFWVVKNGIKMTAMPSFGKIGTDDQEIWRIVAFIKKLPSVSAADYKTWTAPPPPPPPAAVAPPAPAPAPPVLPPAAPTPAAPPPAANQ
jgi:mono/diheme cytochrome c family protein